MEEWGELMRFYYDRPTHYRDSDLTLNYLGFWTDGGTTATLQGINVSSTTEIDLVTNPLPFIMCTGAFYFYNTEPGKNYQDTILEVKSYAEKVKLPYK